MGRMDSLLDMLHLFCLWDTQLEQGLVRQLWNLKRDLCIEVVVVSIFKGLLSHFSQPDKQNKASVFTHVPFTDEKTATLA